jgi:hypothetical protein
MFPSSGTVLWEVVLYIWKWAASDKWGRNETEERYTTQFGATALLRKEGDRTISWGQLNLKWNYEKIFLLPRPYHRRWKRWRGNERRHRNNFPCEHAVCDRLCSLVVRVPGYRSRGLRFDSRLYQIFWEVVGLERSPLSLVNTIEELLERNSGSGLENHDYVSRDPQRWPRDTVYPQKVAPSSPTSGGCSVGIVRSRTKATASFVYYYMRFAKICTKLVSKQVLN